MAILLVLMFHLGPAKVPLFAAYVIQSGWLGVDLFFVLSGFLITGILLDSAGRHGYYRNFIVRRTLRIFPLYYACLVLACMTSSWPGPIRWSAFLHSSGWWYATFLGNIQVFIENKWPIGSLTALWSLQVEEQFYLTFPLLVLLLKRTTLANVLIASVAGALALRIALTILLPANITGTYVLMPCRMDSLAIGGLIAIAQRGSPELLKARWIGWVTVVSALLVVWICRTYGPSPWSAAMRTVGFSAADFAYGGTVALLIGRRWRPLLAICRLRPLVWIGTISYGIYLLQDPASALVRRFAPVVGIASGTLLESLACAIASIAAAWASWRLFESPILRLRDRFTVRDAAIELAS